MKKIVFTSLLSFIVSCLTVSAYAQTITTVAGCGVGDDSLATRAELVGPVGITVDNITGNTYIVDEGSYRVRKVDPSGVITTFAGNGTPGYAGDGGPATDARVGVLYGITTDRYGNVYFVDDQNNCVRKVNTAGIITTVAGTGTGGYTGDGGPATAAQFNTPIDVVVDTAGNIYVTDWLNNVVRKINTSGIISTCVGTGAMTGSGAGGPATASSIGRPFRVAIDNKGNLYVAQVVFQCICKVDPAGIITIIGGTGAYAIGPDGDGGPATDATMTSPCGLAVDTFGNVFFSDIGNQRIRKIDGTTGIISNYAANGTAGYGGDGGPATAAMISTPEAVACDLAGNVYICDADNNRIRKADLAGTITTFAGQNTLFGEGYAATNAEMCAPANIATDAAGNVYIADYANNRIRKLTVATGVITTVAGSGVAGYDDGYNGDNIPALTANIYGPVAVAVDGAGNIYIADGNNQRIRKVDAAGNITTIAGTGTAGYSGNGAPATASEINYVSGIAVDPSGNVFICDEENQRVRKISTSGIITTIAGTGTTGFSGDGGPATVARLSYPRDVAVDGMGNVYISDEGNNRIRKVDNAGNISTIAGSTVPGFSGDNGPAIDAQLAYPIGIKADNNGNIYFVDGGNVRIRMIDSNGIITTVAGNGTPGFSGDGGPAVAAMLSSPAGVAIDNSGNLYIADGNNQRIRKVGLSYLSVPPVPGKIVPHNVQVYPDPASDVITIANAANSEAVFFDMAGKEIMRSAIVSNKQTLNIADLAAGLYLVRITNDKGAQQLVKVSKK